jgi:hypothetical protein
MEKKVNEKVESLNHSQQKAASPKEKCLKDAKDKKSIEQVLYNILIAMPRFTFCFFMVKMI